MSLIKYVSPSGWDWERPVAMEILISSRGLIGNDRVDFVKSAGHMFLDELDKIKFAKDEVPVHLIALGASEAYGPNRNGDGFKEATCKQHHDTFVKFAKFQPLPDNNEKFLEQAYEVVLKTKFKEDLTSKKEDNYNKSEKTTISEDSSEKKISTNQELTSEQ